MPSLRLTASVSPSASASPPQSGFDSGVAQNEFTDAASLFSSLLNQIRSNGGSAGQNGLSASLSGGAASSTGAHPSSVLPELSSSWKSFLNGWSSKLKSGGQSQYLRHSAPSSNDTVTAGGNAPKRVHDNASNGNGYNIGGSAVCKTQDAHASKTSGNSGADCHGNSGSNGSSAGNGLRGSTDTTGAAPIDAATSPQPQVAEDSESGNSSVTSGDTCSDASPTQLPDLFAEIQSLLAQLQQRLQAPTEGSQQSEGPAQDCGNPEDNLSEDSASAGLLISPDGGSGNIDSPVLADNVAVDPTGGPNAQTQGAETNQTGEGALGDAQNMLEELLTLARSLDDRLGMSLHAKNTPSADTSPASEIGHQLASDLKSIADSLKAVLSSAQHTPAQEILSEKPGATDQVANDPSFPDVSSLAAHDDPSVELTGKALSTAEHMISQIASLSNKAGDNQVSAGRLAPTSVFGSQDNLHALFNAFPSGGGADGGSADPGSFGQQGGAASGYFANANSGNFALPAGAEGAKGSGPYSFANQLASLRSANSGLTSLFPSSEQVIVHLHRALANGDNRLSIQLNPVELGRIDIKLDMTSDGKVQGTVVASNPSTLDMLQKDSRGLERALQEAGFQADPGSLSFSLGGQQKDDASGQAAQNNGFGHSGSARDAAVPSEALTAGPGIDEFPETWIVSPNRVNVRI